MPTPPITVEVAPGELIDRLTILEIKLAKIADAAKLRNVRHEYDVMSAALARAVPDAHRLQALRDELKQVNLALWEVEDRIRDHERERNFGASFVELARSVYKTNDRRAAIKRAINDQLGSAIVDEKSYAAY